MPSSDPLVSVDWLAANLHRPDLAVLDATLPPVGVQPAVDTYARYLGQHIPGAVFFDIEALSDAHSQLPHMLPDEASFAAAMSALGISDGMTLVVYEQEGLFSAPRAWWMLRTFGATEVSVLDGGLRAWMEAGQPIENGAVQRPPAVFEAHRNADAVRSLAQVRALLQQGGQVVDARSAARFQGTAPEPRAGLPSGHMPGSISLPYTEVAVEGRLKAPMELGQVFAGRGVDLHKPITTSCGSGVTAAVLALALERCGARDVSLYDGSWTEYAQQPESAIATGP